MVEVNDGKHEEKLKGENIPETETSQSKPEPDVEERNALSLSWCFGFNMSIAGGVHSLSDEQRHALFYVAAHTGVIYDYASRTQKLLQGHCNAITCCCVSEDKRWIVTADSGKDSMLVVWDSVTGNPIKTIFQPHPNGVICMDMSPDAMFIVTLSNCETIENGQFQYISLWEWTVEREGALYTSEVYTEDLQTCVHFNTYDIREIVTNGKQRVIFWNWKDRKLLFYSPPISQRDFKQSIGSFTQSIFVPDSEQAVTGTKDGDIILWDTCTIKDDPEDEQPLRDKRAIKIIRVCSADDSTMSSINFLLDIDGYLVIGSGDGAVRFYDFEFRLIAWFEDLNAGSVTSISFANTPIINDNETNAGESGLDVETSEQFKVPDFIVGTKSAFIVGVNPLVFEEYDVNLRRGTLLVQGLNDAVSGLSAHPSQSILSLCCESGAVQLWHYEERRLIMMKTYDVEKLRPHCLLFSPNGKFLLIGFTNGVLKIILHASEMKELASFHHSDTAISIIKMSEDSSFLAVADTSYYISIWRYIEQEPDSDDDTEVIVDSVNDWVYLGRCKSHSKPITGLEFATCHDDAPLLVSVAEDQKLVQYNLNRTSIANGVVVSYLPTPIEMTAIPTACCWHPDRYRLREDLLIIANNEYKLKQWNASNKICRKTTLGPTYGGPINQLIHLSRPKLSTQTTNSLTKDWYCAYSTHEKVIGLLKFPLDGNPNKSMGLIAHPGKISNIEVTHDNQYIITAGGNDLTVNLWKVDTKAVDLVEATNSVEHGGISGFLGLLEGGAGGSFYNEIVDFFYFSQLRTQGEEATGERKITSEIPISEVPNLMRALGFYPTEEEVNHMCSELKYSQFSETTMPVEAVKLDDFIKLYVNHRPVFGIDKAQIEKAFEDLGAKPDIAWDDLRSLLLTKGEKMTEEEITSCLRALVEDEQLGDSLSASSFADKILGFEDYEEEPASPAISNV